MKPYSLLLCLSLFPINIHAQSSVYTEKSRPAQFDFETFPTDAGWRTYDLDGKSTFIFGGSKAWYWTFEGGSENGVCAATSLFNYSYDESNFVTPVTVPANDWLFSPAFLIPASGSFILEWDARSAHADYYEDYEIRIIDADLLNDLEASFSSSMTLSEVSAIMIENSTPIYKVLQENPEWTSHSVSINKYRGQKVSFIWRYISNHSSVLYVDNYRVVEQADRTFDVTAGVPGLPYSYTAVPEFMAGTLTGFDMSVMNLSDDDLRGVTSNVAMLDVNGDEIVNFDFESASVAAGETAEFTETISRDDALKMIAEPYTLRITTAAEGGFTDVYQYDKTASSEVTEGTLAWETTGGATYSIATNCSDKKLGQRFPIWVDAELQSVSFKLSNATTLSTTFVSVYEEVDGDFILLGETRPVSITPGVEQVYTAELSKPFSLKAGNTYFVAVSEESDKMLGIVRSGNDHGRIAAEYSSLENHWVEQGYGVTYAIWMNLQKAESGVENITTEVSDMIDIDSDGVMRLTGEGRYIVVNAQGSVVASGRCTDDKTEVNLSLPRGFYVIKFNNSTLKVML